MKKLVQFFCFVLFFIPDSSYGQAIDNTASLHDLPEEKYSRFHYDNDFFAATDYYYSQGINMEIVNPSFSRFFLSRILFVKNNSGVSYGISVEHNAYTPTSIRHNEILRGDRPFSACLFLKTFCVSTDTIHRVRFSSVFSAGIFGESAFGEGMQKGIHHWLNNIQPLGWENQIRNDIIINYEMNHEKEILFCGNNFSLSSNAQIRIGTLSDKLQAGFTLQLGKFSSAFRSSEKNNFEFYFYGQPLVNLIAYDATLQGGLLNRKSPHVLEASQIARVVFQNNLGVVIRLKKIYLEYYQSILTKEFETGRYHRWGGVKVGVNIL